MRPSFLVTGGAGFIGSTLCEKLLMTGATVTVVDNFDPFYDKRIKIQNLTFCTQFSNFRFIQANIKKLEKLKTILRSVQFNTIVHLAAKAGVRPSIKSPLSYQEVNVKGTQNLLEIAKERKIEQFVFASSSSVYGVNPDVPWSEENHVLMPISPYASTKISGELLGHVYSHLYGIRFIGLRFFTVYGPRQRPDLAIHKFTKKIIAGEPIPVFGDGSTRRDYTYVSDIVDGILAAITYKDSMYEIINLGNHHTVSLSELISSIENVLEKKAIINRLPMQEGDVPQTFANIDKAKSLLGYTPNIPFHKGIAQFVEWLKMEHKQTRLSFEHEKYSLSK